MLAKETIEVVEEEEEAPQVDGHPGQGNGDSGEDERGAATIAGEVGVGEEMTQPLKTQKGPLFGADRAQAEGMFDVSFGKKIFLSQVEDNTHRILELRVYVLLRVYVCRILLWRSHRLLTVSGGMIRRG